MVVSGHVCACRAIHACSNRMGIIIIDTNTLSKFESINLVFQNINY